MAFDFDALFKNAVQAGVDAAKPGGKAAEDWIRKSARANRDTLRAIAEGAADGQISGPTAQMLLRENARTLESEALALQVILRATAQGAVNAFVGRLSQGIAAALKLAP